ncbi:hypothetical protein ACIBCH_36665 [Amycolatopsis thailandensis]|uniref:hypothetical protein n=1 Tax=Amycolatopsis thailandensis TaxID=589330 RepID=UPI0037A295EF
MRDASGATRGLDKAARDLRKALNHEEDAAGRARVAAARLAEVQKNAKAKASELAAAQEDAARASRALAVAQDNSAHAARRFEQAQKDAATEADRSAKKVEDSMSRMAKRTNMQFDALKFTALTAGLPAAAVVGAAGVTAALGLAAGGFAALGVAGVAHTDQVRDSVGRLKTTVVDDVRAMAAPLQDDVVGALDDVGAAWGRMGPSVASAMRASAPAVREFTGAATDLAENALPGMVTAAKASLPVLEGVRRFSAQAGTGLGEFFANASQGSKGASDGLTILGGTVRTVESRLGTMFGNLATGSAGPLRSFDVIVDKVTGGLVDMTSQGSGVVGMLQGASTAGAGAATILGGVLSAASALPAPVTQFAGALGIANMAMSRLSNGNATLGTGFQGLGDRIRSAEGAGGKLKTTMGGLVTGVLNPATAATAGLGLAMLIMGQQQERAAEAAAHHADSMRSYTSALRESKGAIDADVRAKVAQDLAQKNVGETGKSLLDFSKQFGLALPDVTSAVIGQTGALDNVKSSLDRYKAAHPEAAGAVDALKAAIMSKSIAFKSSESAITAEAAATDGSTAAQNAHRDAVNANTDAIYRQQNAALGYRGAVLNSKAALDEYIKTTKDGKASQDDKARSLLQVEQAFAAQAQAAYQSAYANSKSKDESVRTSEAFAAQNAEIVRLAGSFQGPLPASLQETISKMTTTQAKAAGLTVEIDRTGAAVYRLPDGRQIKLTGDNGQAMAAINEVQRSMNAIRDKQVTITVQQRYAQTGGTGNAISQTGRQVAYAAGGLVGYANGGAISSLPGLATGGIRPLDIRGGGRISGPGTGTSDSILAMSSRGPVGVSNREFVVNAEDTERTLPLLRFINAGGLRGYADGGLIGAAREALARVQGGGEFFEDFSYKGASANLSTYNDTLAGLYYGTGAAFAEAPLTSWLSGYIAKQQPQASAVQQAIQSGNVVTQAPTYSAPSRSSSGQANGGDFTGNLYLDNGQFLGVVRGEIRADKRATRRAVAAGAGAAR